MIDGFLSKLAEIMSGGTLLAPLCALLAGVLTSFTPCCLSTVPLIIGYVGSVGESGRKSFLYSVIFAAGNAVTFTALGVAAAAAGQVFANYSRVWYALLGVLMILMALQTFGVINVVPSARLLGKNTKRGAFGAFIAGLLAGLFSSPCATPVIIALLAAAAGGKNLASGALLMLCYGVGCGALSVLAGSFTGFAKKLKESPSYRGLSKAINIILGVLILLLGFYMLYSAF